MSARAATDGAGRSWRQGLLAVLRHELRVLAHAPMTPVFIGGFLVTLAAAVFIAGDFYSSDHAAADILWTFLPWTAVVFVPALAMRVLAEEQGDRSLELVLTLPVADSAVIAGKWCAGAAMLALALAGTVPFVATLAYLGEPDWGALASGYAGALLLLLGFLAMALLATAVTRDVAGGYVLGLVLLLLLLLSGWDATQRFLESTWAAPLASALSSLSPKMWLDRMASGRVEAGALVAFAAVCGPALAGTLWAVRARRKGGLGPKAAGAGLAIVAVALAATMLAARLPPIADLSAGRAYTLHPETIAAARGVPAGTTVDFYWSPDETRVPASIRAHADRARMLLRSLARYSSGRLAIVEHNAAAESDAEAAALTAGLRRVPMTSGDSFVLGAVFRQGGRQGTISYLDIRREQLLEYDVALALTGIGRVRTPRVGILSPLLSPRNVDEPREGLAVLEELKASYDVAIVPHFADRLPEDLDAVLVVGATILRRDMLVALDQHVMRGRGLVVLIDPHARFSNVSEIVVPQPSPEINDISDLLLRYGARFEPDAVVGDKDLASPVTGTGERQISYPFWMRLGRQQLNSQHAVTANLNELLLAEPGSFAIERPGAVTALIGTTGPSTGALARSAASGKSAEQLAAMFVPDGRPRALAVAFEGPLESAFGAEPGRTADGSRRARAPSPGAVFAVADIDFVFDPLSLQHVTAGERSHTRPINDNLALLLNMVEAATGDPRLLAIRSRGTLQRPFTRVARLLGDAQNRYRDEEARLLAAIGKVEGDVRKVIEIAGVKEVSELPKAIQQKITALLAQLQPYRRELRRIRLGMRQEVDRLGTRLTLANLTAGPVLAAMFALAVRRRRRRRHALLCAE